jgi:RNA polymerase sigma factor (sigma-70 family)
MHRPYVDHQTDFDTLYRVYWHPIVRFCAKCLASLPDGTAEEVAQDVFLAAYNAIARQRFRGESPFSTWLFGIARNLCSKARRDAYRKTTADTIRRLEREVARLERAVVHLEGQPSLLTRQQAQRLQAQLMACAHAAPATPCEEQLLASDHQAVMRDSLQHLAQRHRRAYTLLYTHVVSEIPVPEIATLQGMSRSAVYRRLTWAKTGAVRRIKPVRTCGSNAATPGAALWERNPEEIFLQLPNGS